MPLPLPTPPGSRVYIVDDEWSIAESLATILNQAGFRAEPFHNPGRVLVRSISSPPDVLISDIVMPEMTGIELDVALRRAGRDCPVLLVSGHPDARQMLVPARRMGFRFGLLQKPIHPMQLLLRLNNLRLPIVAPLPSRPFAIGPERAPELPTAV